jgi:hypothetical protein
MVSSTVAVAAPEASKSYVPKYDLNRIMSENSEKYAL